MDACLRRLSSPNGMVSYNSALLTTMNNSDAPAPAGHQRRRFREVATPPDVHPQTTALITADLPTEERGLAPGS